MRSRQASGQPAAVALKLLDSSRGALCRCRAFGTGRGAREPRLDLRTAGGTGKNATVRGDKGRCAGNAEALAEGRAQIALFTSRSQVEHAFAVAAEEGLEAALRERLSKGVVASIGPVCSEALRAEGLEPDLEPSVGRMGQLVKESAARSAAILASKQK